MAYKIGAAGLTLIKEFEKFEPRPYRDSKGIWTIGYGTIRINGLPVTSATPPITEARASELLADHLVGCETTLTNTTFASLTQNQVDALLCFMYNVGESGWVRSSLRRCINQHEPIFEDLFTRWNKIRDPKTGQVRELAGLTRRRRAEYQLFVTP